MEKTLKKVTLYISILLIVLSITVSALQLLKKTHAYVNPNWYLDYDYELDTCGNYEYCTLDSDTPIIVLKKYQGSDTDITIPGSATIDGVDLFVKERYFNNIS